MTKKLFYNKNKLIQNMNRFKITSRRLNENKDKHGFNFVE